MNITRKAPLALVALTAVLAIGSCGGPPEEPAHTWTSARVSVSSDRVLWKVTQLALQKMDFPLGAGLDRDLMTISTGWRTALAPFSKDGHRERAEVKMEPVSAGIWRVAVTVKRQLNVTLVKPLDPTYAEWEWAPDDAYQARILLQHVKSFLSPDLPFSEG